MERPVTFLNQSGLILFGMLYEPDRCSSSNKVGIIISVNEVKYRIGSFRYHVLLARKLAKNGYYVLCFDPSGIGDSEGFFEDKLLTEHQSDIVSGKFVEDTQCAIDFLYQEIQLDQLLLFGLCGGAMTVLITASLDERVNGLILLGLPISFPPSKNNNEKLEETEFIYAKDQAYQKLISISLKSVSLKYWKKIFIGNIEWRSIFRIIYKCLVVIGKSLMQKNRRQQFNFNWKNEAPISNNQFYNRLFQDSFSEAVKNGSEIIFIYGGTDPVGWEFKGEVYDKYFTSENMLKSSISVSFIKNANHIFSGKESQIKLDFLIEDWVKKHFPSNDEKHIGKF